MNSEGKGDFTECENPELNKSVRRRAKYLMNMQKSYKKEINASPKQVKTNEGSSSKEVRNICFTQESQNKNNSSNRKQDYYTFDIPDDNPNTQEAIQEANNLNYDHVKLENVIQPEERQAKSGKDKEKLRRKFSKFPKLHNEYSSILDNCGSASATQQDLLNICDLNKNEKESIMETAFLSQNKTTTHRNSLEYSDNSSIINTLQKEKQIITPKRTTPHKESNSFNTSGNILEFLLINIKKVLVSVTSSKKVLLTVKQVYRNLRGELEEVFFSINSGLIFFVFKEELDAVIHNSLHKDPSLISSSYYTNIEYKRKKLYHDDNSILSGIDLFPLHIQRENKGTNDYCLVIKRFCDKDLSLKVKELFILDDLKRYSLSEYLEETENTNDKHKNTSESQSKSYIFWIINCIWNVLSCNNNK